MSNLNEYIGPLVEKEKNFKIIFKKLKEGIEVIWHGLTPHKLAKEAVRKISGDSMAKCNQEDIYYNSSLEMYKESKERIKQLEEKAFKLLTYISVLSAILFFFLGKELNGATKVIVLISIVLLVIAMIISLRCIGTKTQKAFFIDSLFDFDKEKLELKKKNEICAELINCAVYNQTVADNTADILKASRYILSYGIFTTVLSLVLYFTSNNTSSRENIQKVSISFTDTTFVDSIYNKLTLHNQTLKELNEILNQAKVVYEKNIYQQVSNNNNTKEPIKDKPKSH